jgi:hypothetical protein
VSPGAGLSTEGLDRGGEGGVWQVVFLSDRGGFRDAEARPSIQLDYSVEGALNGPEQPHRTIEIARGNRWLILRIDAPGRARRVAGRRGGHARLRGGALSRSSEIEKTRARLTTVHRHRLDLIGEGLRHRRPVDRGDGDPIDIDIG